MASYDTKCQSCENQWEQVHLMRQAHAPCPKCHSKDVKTVIGQVNVRPSQDAGWEGEENGRGRYFSQLETSATCTRSPENFFRSRNAALEACKRRGFIITK